MFEDTDDFLRSTLSNASKDQLLDLSHVMFMCVFRMVSEMVEKCGNELPPPDIDLMLREIEQKMYNIVKDHKETLQ